MSNSNRKAGITIFLNDGSIDVKLRHEDGGPQEVVAKIPNAHIGDFSHDRKKHCLKPADLGNGKRGFLFTQGRRYKNVKVWPQAKGHFFGSFDQEERSVGSYDQLLADLESQGKA